MKVEVKDIMQELQDNLRSAASADAFADRFLVEAAKVAEAIRESGRFMVEWLASAPLASEGLLVNVNRRRYSESMALCDQSRKGVLGTEWQVWLRKLDTHFDGNRVGQGSDLRFWENATMYDSTDVSVNVVQVVEPVVEPDETVCP